jgi:3-oxoacyl-[acyl-carrier protein] reductase
MNGQTALVTGGSRGIGRAICLELARKGCNIVLCYAGNEPAAQETAAQCEALGREVLTIQCPVGDSQQVKTMMETAVERFGRIDILVNNAGITRDSLMLTMKDEDFDAVLDTNLRGTYLCMRHAVRQMLRQKYGRIISISSVVGLRGNAGQCNYAASKAGIIGLTKSLARELAPRNITVNAVAPGYIETEMTASLSEDVKKQLKSQIPAGCLGTPEQVAQAVAFFVDAAYITGQVLRVDGGMAM